MESFDRCQVFWMVMRKKWPRKDKVMPQNVVTMVNITMFVNIWICLNIRNVVWISQSCLNIWKLSEYLQVIFHLNIFWISEFGSDLNLNLNIWTSELSERGPWVRATYAGIHATRAGIHATCAGRKVPVRPRNVSIPWIFGWVHRKFSWSYHIH